MRYASLILLAALLFTIAACKQESSTSNAYNRYDNVMNMEKPVAYGEDQDIYIFASKTLRESLSPVLDATLARKYVLTIEEQCFFPTYEDISEIEEYSKYKNLILCGVLGGDDAVSKYMLKNLDEGLVQAARESGGEIFVVNNLYVRDQIILYILAKDEASLEDLVNQRSSQIFDYFINKYKQRLAYQAYRSEVVEDRFFEDRPFSIKIPVLYRLFKDEKAEDAEEYFLSFIFQPANPNANLADKYVSVYHEPMPENEIDAQWLYNKRQELTAKYLDGDEILDDKYSVEETELAGYKALRMYGHWVNRELVGGVGGAFQTYAFWHDSTETAYLVDNIVYFPDGNKLPVLLELSMISESISVK
jgi:hypothetical protein